jgi:hypothetical protein
MSGFPGTPLPSFVEGPAEVRFSVYRLILKDARLLVSGNRPLAANSQPGTATTQPSSRDNVNASDFPWQLAATCTKIRGEFLPHLHSATTVYYHKDGPGVFDFMQVIPATYLNGMQQLRTAYSDSLTLRPSDIPALKRFEIKLPPIEWMPRCKSDVNAAFNGITTNAGLLTMSRQSIRAGLPQGLNAAWLDQIVLPEKVKLVVSTVFRACLPSKIDMLEIRGVDPVPDIDDADVSFVSAFPMPSKLKC